MDINDDAPTLSTVGIPFSIGHSAALIGWNSTSTRSNLKTRFQSVSGEAKDPTLGEIDENSDSNYTSEDNISTTNDSASENGDNANNDFQLDKCNSQDMDDEGSQFVTNERLADSNLISGNSISCKIQQDMVAPGVRVVTGDGLERSFEPSFCQSQRIVHATDVIRLRFEQPDAMLALRGRFNLCVMRGEVEIMGYRVSADSTRIPLQINSSRLLAALVIRNSIKASQQLETRLEQKPQTSLCSNNALEDRTIDASQMTLIELRLMPSPTRSCDETNLRSPMQSIILEHIGDPRNFRHVRISQLWRVAMDTVISHTMSRGTSAKSIQRELDVKNQCTEDVNKHMDLQSIVESDKELKIEPVRMLICGAKNRGKSTFLRYAVNRLFSTKTKRVAVLDCDMGQPELSVPGMLTLTILSKPLLGPPHHHMVCGGRRQDKTETLEHERAYFFGHLSSKEHPQKFLLMIADLIRAYESLIVKGEENEKSAEDTVCWASNSRVANGAKTKFVSSIPLVVNTDGWATSMGKDMLSALTDIVKPNYLVFLSAKDEKIPYSFTENSERSTHQEILTIDEKGGAWQNRTESPIEVLGLPEIVKRRKKQCSSLLFSAKEMRTVRFTSYLCGSGSCLKLDEKGLIGHEAAALLASQSPYKIPFDSLEYQLPHENDLDSFEEDMIMDCLEANIVGLCCRQGIEKRMPSLNSTLHPCIGLGLVRSIDRKTRTLYICTPVQYARLIEVEILVVGNLGMPPSLFNSIKGQHVPFTGDSLPEMALGHKSMQANQ